jgi:hypothetical protein
MKSRILQSAALIAALLAGSQGARAQNMPAGPGGPPAGEPVLTAGGDTVYGALFGGDAQYSSCDGFGCGGEPAPSFGYTRFDLLFMRRSPTSTVLFASNGNNLALSTGNLDNRFEGVGRFALGVPLCPDILIEGVYMGLQEWESRATLVSPVGDLLSPYSNFGNFPPGITPGVFNSEFANLATISYSSRFNSAEMNIWCRLPQSGCGSEFWFLQGVRYFQQREHLDYSTNRVLPPASTSNTNVNTENDLVGYQLGLRWSACITGCLHLDMEVKSGVYLVNARQDTLTNATVAGGATVLEQSRKDDVAFIGEGDLTLVYDICPWLSIGGGYRVLDVFGVALAPDNFSPLPPPATGLRVPRTDTNGNVFYQGASLKLEVRY